MEVFPKLVYEVCKCNQNQILTKQQLVLKSILFCSFATLVWISVRFCGHKVGRCRNDLTMPKGRDIYHQTFFQKRMS